MNQRIVVRKHCVNCEASVESSVMISSQEEYREATSDYAFIKLAYFFFSCSCVSCKCVFVCARLCVCVMKYFIF